MVKRDDFFGGRGTCFLISTPLYIRKGKKNPYQKFFVAQNFIKMDQENFFERVIVKLRTIF